MKENLSQVIDKWKNYLHSHIREWICSSFWQMRRGASTGRTSACIWSALSEIWEVRDDILKALLKLQRDSGGRAYNDLAPEDADSTLRVIQFFNKIWFTDNTIIEPALSYVYAHQDTLSWGIQTFTNQELITMWRPDRVRYALPHLDVSVVALNVLPESEQKDKLKKYINNELNNTLNSYWWRTDYYVAYEMWRECHEKHDDSISLGLKILLDAKLWNRYTDAQIKDIIKLQNQDWSFPSSKQLQLPRPLVPYDKHAHEEIELIEDQNMIFSTATLLVALQRQGDLL
jgi:hypothetical protein